MTTNRFETFVQRDAEMKAAAKNEAIKRAIEEEKAERDQKALIELRKQQHVGDSPADLWGDEAAAMCEEFLEFVGKLSTGRPTFLGAAELREPDVKEKYQAGTEGRFKKRPIFRERVISTGWNTLGYGVAYTNPSSLETTSINTELSANPARDAFLCVDGLIRAGASPLRLDETGTKPIVPKFGIWNITSTREEMYIDGGTSSGSTSKTVPYNLYRRVFTEIDAVVGLNEALNRHALAISALSENTH